MTNYHLPETANDNRWTPPRDRDIANFECSLKNGERLDWLDSTDFMEQYHALPQWYRAQIEATVPKPKIILRDEPKIEELFCVPKDLPDCIINPYRVASVQPHHLMSETIERSHILHIDAALADPYDWRIFYQLLSSTPVIMRTPGNFLASVRQAITFALNRQLCIWVDLDGADRYWADRLRRFERTFEGDGR